MNYQQFCSIGKLRVFTYVLCQHSAEQKEICQSFWLKTTEEKAKVVAAVWGTELLLFLALLAVLHQDDMKKRMNCTKMI